MRFRSLCCRLLPALLLVLPAGILLLGGGYQPVSLRHEVEVVEGAQRNNASWRNGARFSRMMEARMGWRRRHLKEACSRLGLDTPGNDSLHRPNPWEFLINRPHRLVWCNIFKAASTSWMFNFNLLAGYRPQFLRRSTTVPLQLARRRYPRPSLAQLRAALNSSLAFLIVRHPFQRLLSAYRDKILNAWPNSPHKRLGKVIIAHYRLSKKSGIAKSHPPPKSRFPTFAEFVSYLEENGAARKDMHWVPMAEFCTPCQIDFDVIAKFETLEEDQQYLIELAGVGDTIKPEWKNPSKGRDTTDVMTNYYSQLTTSQVHQLYNMYRFDFELFGYSPAEYLKVAMPDPTVSEAPL